MKKILTILTITLTLTLTITAQTARPLRVYLASGVVDKMALSSGSSMYHSRLDLDGVEHDDYVSLVVADGDGEHRYLLSQVDSLVMPNGRRVVFQGSMTVQPSEARLVTEDSDTYSGPHRSSFSGTFPGQGKDNVTFFWTENDRIRLDVGYESRASQLTTDKTGAQFVFDSADLDAASYTVYYPGKSVTVLSEQTQTGADNSDHIGPSGDCGTATAMLNDNDNGTYSFTLEHKAAYLCFLPHIDYLPSVRIDKIVLTCNNAIAGTYQLASGGLYNSSATSNTITLNLVPQHDKDFLIGHNVSTEQDSCAAYMVIAPQDASRSFTATYYVTDTLSNMSKVFYQTFSFRPLANTVYPISCNIRDKDFHVVDLGLSCNWSNVNIDAKEPSLLGTYFENDADANAALLAKTVVTEWLMPDADQVQEIIEKCQWTWGIYNGKTGYIVTAPAASKEDGNVHRLFIPYASTTPVTPAQCLAANNRPVEVLMVDLGLTSKVKWAARNIGANSVEEHGDYYAWGETETKSDYSSSTYLYGTRNLGNNCDISGTELDAAVVKWGGIWRMPTLTEMQELLSDCTWTWDAINGVNGYIVEGVNGNRIFLPCTGVMKGTTLGYVNSGGGYQISQGVADSWNVYTLSWYLTTKNIYYNNTGHEPYPYDSGTNYNILVARYYGRPIRPVAAPNAVLPDGTMLNIVTDSASWKLGDTSVTLYGTVSSSTPIKGTIKVGFVVGDSTNIVIGKGRFENEQERSVAGLFSYTLPVFDNIGYWYRAYVATADTTIYGEAKHYGYEMVDLGLSVQWANMNIGADAPEDFGYYYAWGETKTKNDYSSVTYAYGTTQNLGDGYDIAGSEQDAAHVNMGNSWRMPTWIELEELIDNCDWAWVTQNSVNGYRVTSRKNNNSIFLPAAGIMKGGTLMYPNQGVAYISSKGEENSERVHVFAGYESSWQKSYESTYDPYPYNSGYNYGLGTLRYYGHSIRAVASSNAVTSDDVVMNIRTDSVTWKLGDTAATLYATVSSNTPVDEVKVGFVVGDSANIGKDNASDYPQTLTATGRFSQTLSVYNNFGYWFRAYVEVGDQVFYGKAMHYGYEMVDLGLPSGTLWANMNVGAGLPEEYGGYYAWGETIQKNDYSQGTYQHYVAADNLYKNLGEDFDIAGTKLDAAHELMGNLWQLPNSAQLQELSSDTYTTWKWTSQNGVNGYVVTSKQNGRSIFLPATGVKRGTAHEYDKSGAVYMGSTQSDHQYSFYNYNLAFYTTSHNVYYTNTYDPFPYNSGYNYGISTLRYLGRSVRPVAVPLSVTTDGKRFVVQTDSASWKMGDTSARIYGSFNTTKPLDASVKVGFVIGDSAMIVKGKGRYEYETVMDEVGSWSTTVEGLQNDLGYWYRSYIEVGGTIFYAKARHFGREMVDLGLPSKTLWSNMDVGAMTPYEPGSFYAWGETSTKPSYTLDSYDYYQNGSYVNIGNDIKATNHDAAYVNMGTLWRMPTSTEMSELCSSSNTTWTWTTQNSVSGYKVQGKNGRYIFLPTAGIRKGDNLEYKLYSGTYHSSTVNTSDSQFNYSLSWYGYSASRGVYYTSTYDPYPYNSGYNYGLSASRYWGRLIRPVANQ